MTSVRSPQYLVNELPNVTDIGGTDKCIGIDMAEQISIALALNMDRVFRMSAVMTDCGQ